ncbi:molecular chaperone HscC [Algimonas porphyrae]|uniref:Molecular chaperone HscC n=1 Tax=Algimonas porphyrae TaxID=1128113 RepID=A0ABQ5UX19_9PROT|nr:molecular chaperone HscC [Algimonas porphyrae]
MPHEWGTPDVTSSPWDNRNSDIIVGIDLGTTNSLIGVFTNDGPSLVENANDSHMTPSAVTLLEKDNIAVGDVAKHRLISHPDLSAARFKRFMGTNKIFKLGKTNYRAEELSAMVLRSLKGDAERMLGQSVSRAVISVPAYFNDLQRKATFAAGRMAGLNVERLINEPTAAALAYGVDTDEDESLLILDLGGGTFDVSILEVFDGIMEVRSSAGDIMLGGEDFTDAIDADFREQLGDIGKSLSSEAAASLRHIAEQAKIALGTIERLSPVYRHDQQEHTLEMTQDRFSEIAKPLLERLRRPIQRALGDAGMMTRDLDRVILVGGATRMPIVRQAITRLMKTFPEHRLDPDKVIALGACVQSGLLARHAALEDRVMTDVSPFTLGIDSSRHGQGGQITTGHFVPIIERNMVIPVSRVDRFQKMHPEQTMVEIDIYQGESPRVDENVFLGKLKLHIGSGKIEESGFDVRFTYDVSGILEVIATVVSTGHEKRLVIEGNSGAMTEGEINERLMGLAALKVHPIEHSINRAAIERCKSLYENSLGDRRQLIEGMLSDFEAIIARQVPKEIETARKQLHENLDMLERDDLL